MLIDIWDTERYTGIQINFESKPTTHRASIPHKCRVCGRSIVKGQTYTRAFTVIDGEAQFAKWHGVSIGDCVNQYDAE